MGGWDDARTGLELTAARWSGGDAVGIARQPRFDLPGIPQHVVQRGNNQERGQVYLEGSTSEPDLIRCRFSFERNAIHRIGCARPWL